MGNICGSPIGTLLARIEECLLPDDRDPLLDIMEEIQGRVNSIIGKKGASQNFVLAKGVPCILKVMRTMIQDDVVLRLGVAIFDYQKDNRLCMVQFITNGGLTVLEDTLTHHPMDTTLSALIPVLQKYVRAAGAGAAVKEISDEAIALQLCEKCQVTLDKLKRAALPPGADVTSGEIKKSADRVNRVLMFMNNYLTRKDVIVNGLNAIIFFSQNADNQKMVTETKLIDTLHKVIEEFRADPGVIWRASVSVRNIAALGPDVAYDITKTNILENLASIFKNFGEVRVRQQILWFYEVLTVHWKSRAKLQMCVPVMTLLRQLIDERTKLETKYKLYPPKDKFEMYKVVIPFKLRIFYSETKGEILQPPSEFQAPDVEQIKTRKPIKQPLMYGTVDTHVFNDTPSTPSLRLVDDAA